MSFSDLYKHIESLRTIPVVLETQVVPFLLENTNQDEIYFVPVELDPEISLGHIKQFRVSRGVYDVDPRWVTQIRYHDQLNMCWRRYVSCKELMHIYDSEDEKSNTPEKFKILVNQLESPPLPEKASPMFYSEIKTKWMALAILCPLPLRDEFKGRWRDDLSDYDVALELRVPEACVPTIIGETFPEIIQFLTE